MQQAPRLPGAFEPDFYRQGYPELAAFSDNEAEQHYRENGIIKGMLATPGASRQHFLPLVQAEQSVLEIGPFATPLIVGDQVAYLDAYDTQELMRRANEMGFDSSKVPVIDYVSSTGTFEMVDRKFGAAFGS